MGNNLNEDCENKAAIRNLRKQKLQKMSNKRTFFVLDFCLDIFNCITGFDLKGDGLAREGLDENLHILAV